MSARLFIRDLRLAKTLEQMKEHNDKRLAEMAKELNKQANTGIALAIRAYLAAKECE
jgi:nicotinamide mononucleotide (NMN) deamidase PncC